MLCVHFIVHLPQKTRAEELLFARGQQKPEIFLSSVLKKHQLVLAMITSFPPHRHWWVEV